MKVFIPAVLFALLCGCETIQTRATEDIDKLLESGIYDSEEPMTMEQKQETKSTLIESRKEIVTYKGIAEKNERLAKQARIFWIITAAIGVIVLIGFLLWLRRLLSRF